MVNGPSWEDGKFGKALSFDGVNDYVEVADSVSLRITEELTIEAWVNEAVRKTESKIVSRRIGTYFYFLGVDDGKPYGGIGDGTSRTVTNKSFIMPSNEWHHLAFVYNDAENKMYLYYDGVLKETVAVTQNLPARTGVKLSIGADHQGTAVFFNGLIDEVRIWKVALSPNQLGFYCFGFKGLLPPYVETKAFKIGSSIPLKWQYTDAAGNVVDSSLANPLVRIVKVGGVLPVDPDDDLIDVTDPGKSGLRYESTTKMWIFNWQTKEGFTTSTTYEIWITSVQTGQVNGPFPIQLK